MTLVHNKGASFHCNQCDYSCLSKGNLKRHSNQVHISAAQNNIEREEGNGSEDDSDHEDYRENNDED